MAKVKNQSIPTDQFEETLDPPIDFKDQYRRALSEGIDHPKLPAGEEIVTFSKKESRPAQRSDNPYYDKPDQQSWRDKFSECKECWKTQYRTDAEINDCHSAGSRHYIEPWTYIPGAQNTAYNQFMSECLNWAKDNPDAAYPKCEDLNISPKEFTICPDDLLPFDVTNGNSPHIVSTNYGTITGDLSIQFPETLEECPETIEVKFIDSDQRKACATGRAKTEDEQCCCNPTPVVISYDSVIMDLNQQQTLSIDPNFPGCPPYSWFLDGGGSLDTTEGDTVVYTSPASNPNCALNPHISVEDSCGTVCAVHFTVSNYAASGTAIAKIDTLLCPHECEYSILDAWHYPVILGRWDYGCDNSFIEEVFYNNDNLYVPPYGKVPTFECYTDPYYAPLYFPCGSAPEDGCQPTGAQAHPECLEMWMNYLLGFSTMGYHDIRSDSQKQNGCCPYNPETGLPY